MPDYANKLIVEVTQDDIDNGTPGERCRCPIARAVKRLINVDPDSDAGIEVYSKWIDMNGHDAYGLPDEAIDFISRFDTDLDVAPFKFTGERIAIEEDEDA